VFKSFVERNASPKQSRNTRQPPPGYYDFSYHAIDGVKYTELDLSKKVGRNQAKHIDDTLPYKQLLDSFDYSCMKGARTTDFGKAR
jgi:hypothetical protein